MFKKIIVQGEIGTFVDGIRGTPQRQPRTLNTHRKSCDRATIAKLQALKGDDFDKAYIKDMLKDHQQDRKEFKHEAEKATNPALKDIATRGEQIISAHLQMIEQIAERNSVVASK